MAKKQITELDKAIGLKLRDLRLQRGVNQVATGDALGVTFQQIQKYENGTNKISAASLKVLADLFNVPVTEFFEETALAQGQTLDKYHRDIMAALQKIKCTKKRQMLRFMTKTYASWEAKANETIN